MKREAGAKAPTIKDVAREAGVSFKTVSRVINRNASVNPEMRAAVEAAMQQLNYKPLSAARALRGQQSFCLALLSGWEHEPPTLFEDDKNTDARFSEFLSELTVGCGIACRKHDYHLVFEFFAYGDRAKAERNMAGLLDNIRPDGVLITPPLCDLPWLLDMFEERGIRYARLLPGVDVARGPSLIIDDFSAAYAVTELLLNAGHRRLAMIAGPPDHFAASKRRMGFEAAVAEIHEADHVVVHGDLLIESGRQRALELLTSPVRPTAIFAANDGMAAGVYAAAAELSLKIPRDLSLIGFDDTLVARLLDPPLTTVRQPVFEIAKKAAEMLIAAANSTRMLSRQLHTIAYSISERATVAPPSQSSATETGSGRGASDH